MNAETLYNEAYNDHYKAKNIQSAFNKYLRLMMLYPSSAECNWADQQIKNIMKSGIGDIPLDEDVKPFYENMLHKEEEKKLQHEEYERARKQAEEEMRLEEERIASLRQNINTILTSTGWEIPGHEITKIRRVVSGSGHVNVLIANGTLGTIQHGFRNLTDSYNKSLKEAEKLAIDSLLEATAEVGGNAVLGITFTLTNYAVNSIRDTISYILCCMASGTAADIQPIEATDQIK